MRSGVLRGVVAAREWVCVCESSHFFCPRTPPCYCMLLYGKLQKAQSILATQKGKAEKAEVYEKQVTQLSGQLSIEKANLENLTAELRREQQKLQQKQTLMQQLQKEKNEAERKLLEEAVAKQKEMEAANNALLQAAGQTLNKEEHPTYGKLLFDFGFKRVYAAKAVTVMAQAQIWKKQRALREHRAAQIAQSKVRSGVQGWPGTISVVERKNKETNTVDMYIIDGQVSQPEKCTPPFLPGAGEVIV